MPDFLLEIGTEEIPARMIDGAREELARRVGELLAARAAWRTSPEIRRTLRRAAWLCWLGSRLGAARRDRAGHRPVAEGRLQGWQAHSRGRGFRAQRLNVPVDALEKITTPKGEYLAATVQKKGRAASEILAESLPKEIAGIYWAKNMYWRGKSAERFVRPVRWLVALLDGEVVPLEFAGIRAGDTSEGHRILSSGDGRRSRSPANTPRRSPAVG